MDDNEDDGVCDGDDGWINFSFRVYNVLMSKYFALENNPVCE